MCLVNCCVCLRVLASRHAARHARVHMGKRALGANRVFESHAHNSQTLSIYRVCLDHHQLLPFRCYTLVPALAVLAVPPEALVHAHADPATLEAIST